MKRLLVGLFVLSACDKGAVPSTPTPTTTTTTTATATATATSTATSAATPTSTASAAASGGFPVWASYPGPKDGGPTTVGKRVFVVRPKKVDWDKGVTLSLAELVRDDGGDRVVKALMFPEHGSSGDQELRVPRAMTCATAGDQKFAKGDVVMTVAAGTTSDFGRVTEATSEDGHTSLEVASRWVSRQESSFLADEVLKISDELTCGQRVRYKSSDGREDRWATLVTVSGADAWVIGFPENKFDEVLMSLPAKSIAPMAITKAFADGSAVLVATANHTLVAGKVLKTIDGGVGYSVHIDSGDQDSDFEEVTAK